MDFKKNSAQKGALQKYEEFMSYARRTSPNSYPGVVSGGPIHDGERAVDETAFVEISRFRLCPREKKYGIQIPKMAWHTIEVYESSTIFEAKDGAYGK